MPLLEKEDYEESCACTRQETRIPVSRVLGRLDELLFRKDFDGAKKHLSYWKNEAALLCDRQGLLAVLNEQLGLYRKTGDKEAAFAAVGEAEALAGEEGIVRSTVGTTYLNIATVCCAFEEYERAIGYYERAKEIYEETLPAPDGRMAGLYNNLALALTGAGRYAEARAGFERALAILRELPEGAAEIGVTYCNSADLAYAERGWPAAKPEVARLLAAAMEAFRSVGQRDGAYAYACEKCAPIMDWYGFENEAKELESEAKRIYEGT